MIRTAGATVDEPARAGESASALSGSARGAGRLRRACILGAVCAWALFAVVLVHDGGLLHRDVNGNFYDAQADALLHGHWNVSAAELGLEGFAVDGKIYTYFGPVPAVARMPVEAITHRFHGRLTRLSMLLAEAVLLAFVVKLVLLSRPVELGGDVARDRGGPDGTDPAPGSAAVWVYGLFVFAAGASSTLFLAGKSWVYHEDLLWGAALSLGSLSMLGGFLTTRRRRRLLWACVLAGLALLTRASVGAGPVAALVLAGLVEAWRWWRRGRTRTGEALRTVAAMAAGVIVPVVLYAAINVAKFGTLFSLPIGSQILTKYDEMRQAALAANHGSLFGLQYLPTQLLQSIRPDALDLTRLFPFVGFPRHPATVIGGAVFATLDPTSSIPASEPLLFLLALAGIGVLIWPRHAGRGGAERLWWVPVLGGAAGAVGYVVIGYVANRYFTDLLPFLVVAGVLGLHGILHRVGGRGRQVASRGLVSRGLVSRGLAVLAVALVAFGTWVNASLATEYHYVMTPGTAATSRAGWLSLQLRVDADLHGAAPLSSIVQAAALPKVASRGETVIVGDCAAMYRNDGSYWRLVEGGPGVTATLRGHVASAPRGGAVVVASKAAGARRATIVWRTLPDGRHRMDLDVVGPNGARRVLPGTRELRSGRLPEPLSVRFDPYTNATTVSHGAVKYLDVLMGVPASPIQPGPGLHASFGSMSVCRAAQAKAGGAS